MVALALPRHAAALSLLLLSACSWPRFEARRELSRDDGAAGLASIECSSHNGAIEVVGVPGAARVAVTAALSARGASAAAAQQHVEMLDVELVRRGDALVVAGVVPTTFDDGWQATFAYRIEVPPGLSLKLRTHNGEIVVQAMDGEVDASSHNGGIRAATRGGAIALLTHNGAIDLDLLGTGAVRGDVRSHNGGIALRLGDRAAVVDASSNNGALVAVGKFAVRSHRDGVLRLVSGEGGGQLSLATHNGPIEIH